MARNVCLLLSALVLPALTSAVKVTPVQQVLSMLEEMKGKGEKAMAVEKMVFADYKEWVDDEVTQLGFEIKTGKSTISKLIATADKADSDVASLKTAIAKLDGEIATMEGEKKAAIAEREEEHAEYMTVAADYSESVEALQMAIMTLKKENYDRPQAMLQLQKMAGQKRGMRRVLAALLQQDESKASVLGGPEVAAYEFQSGGIIEVLEKLLDKFQGQLADTEAAESNAAHAHSMAMIHLDNLLTESNQDREEKAGVKAKRAGDSEAAKSELADTKKDLAHDEKTLSDTKATFAAKKDQFEANQEVRAAELEALGKAIEIIADPSVAGSYGKHINLAQTPKGKISFLQESSTASSRALLRNAAAELLRKRAKALSSNVLANAAASVEANPFSKVIEMIKALLTKLKEEAADEADHKAWCDKELKANKLKRNKKTSKVGTLSAEVEELGSTIASMGAEIVELSKEQSELATAMKDATNIRSKEKAQNTATIKDSMAASAAVKQALVILKEFYSAQGGAFLETGKQVPEMAAYTGMQSANGGVVGMLEVIEADFSRLTSETRAEESEAASTYASFMEDSKASKQQKHDHEVKLSLQKDQKEFELEQTKKTLAGTQEELDKAVAYYEYLKPNCNEVHVSYEERVARRKEEIEALKEAYKILDQK